MYIINSNNAGDYQPVELGANCASMRDWYSLGIGSRRLAYWETVEELAEWAASVAHYKNAALMGGEPVRPLAIIRDGVAVEMGA